VPFTADNLFPIGSNTKLHIAVAIYQMQEMGLLHVEDAVNDYMPPDMAEFGTPGPWRPQVPGVWDPTCQRPTLVNLMEMSSGLKEPFICDDSGKIIVSILLDAYSGHISDYLGLWINAPMNFVPGTEYHYETGNWILLAYIIERISGQSLSAYLQENIYQYATPDVDNDIIYDPYGGAHALLPRRMDSYRKFIDSDSGAEIATGSCTPYIQPGVVSGAGGSFATIAAEMDLYRILFHSTPLGGPIISEDSVREIMKPRKEMAPGTAAPWFAQGLTVLPSPEGGDVPKAVLYCGGIECTNTCILSLT
ncbi:beta-lactamase/transpeptidase-like protein, partial [Tribonema minus]